MPALLATLSADLRAAFVFIRAILVQPMTFLDTYLQEDEEGARLRNSAWFIYFKLPLLLLSGSILLLGLVGWGVLLVVGILTRSLSLGGFIGAPLGIAFVAVLANISPAISLLIQYYWAAGSLRMRMWLIGGKKMSIETREYLWLYYTIGAQWFNFAFYFIVSLCGGIIVLLCGGVNGINIYYVSPLIAVAIIAFLLLRVYGAWLCYKSVARATAVSIVRVASVFLLTNPLSWLFMLACFVALAGR